MWYLPDLCDVYQMYVMSIHLVIELTTCVPVPGIHRL